MIHDIEMRWLEDQHLQFRVQKVVDAVNPEFPQYKTPKLEWSEWRDVAGIFDPSSR